MSLEVYTVALSAVRALRPAVDKLARHDRSLSEPLRRAAPSVVLNIAEAERSAGGNARLRLCTAAGSARESRAALALGCAWGYVDPAHVAQADQQLDRVCAMLWGLTRRR